MSTGPSSLLGAMEEAAGGKAGEKLAEHGYVPANDQFDMLRDPQGKLPDNAFQQIRQLNRGRGRPPGARNKRSDDVARYFIHKYGDPLDALGEIINTDVDVLYEQMRLAQGGEAKGKNITGKDALAFRLSAIAEAMPYIHQKRPMAVELNGKADAVIFIPGLNAPLGFTQQQLTQAAEALGAEAIEAAGIRLADGTLIEGQATPSQGADE